MTFSWFDGLVLFFAASGVFFLLKETNHIRGQLEEQREQLNEIGERVKQVWDWTLDIDSRTKKWEEHPRCELEQRLWLQSIGFTDVIRALADGHAPSAEQLDRLDKNLGVDTHVGSKKSE